MLNKVSVFDVLACLVRKVKTILILMIVFALVFGGLKYYKNKNVSSIAKQKLSELEPSVNSADSDYSSLNDRIKNLPLFEINPKSTWIATAIYNINAAEMSNEEIEKYCKDLKLRWDTTDLSKSLMDLFNTNPDDEQARSVIDFVVSDEHNLVLTIKAKNKPQCVSVYYMMNSLLSSVFSELNKSQGYSGKLVQKKFEVKKTNDSDISEKQQEMKDKLQQLEVIKNEKHEEYNRIAVDADINRGVKKWSAAGAVLVFIILVVWTICRISIYEPLISVAQVDHETGLECIGILKNRISIIDRIAARISNERIKNTKIEKQKFLDKINQKKTGEKITLVMADDCTKGKNTEALLSCLKENGFDVGKATEDSLISESVNDVPAIIVLTMDRTTVKETTQLISSASNAGYRIEGFVFT